MRSFIESHLTGNRVALGLAVSGMALTGLSAAPIETAAAGTQAAPIEAHTAIAKSLVQPHALITGLSDENLGLMTPNAERFFKKWTAIHHARTIASIGAPANDPQLAAAMQQAEHLHWSIIIAARIPSNPEKGKKPYLPTIKQYTDWLKDVKHTYPKQKITFEAINEPELVRGLTPRRAVQYYRAAQALGVHTLAGGFSDQLGRKHDPFVRQYVKELKENNPRHETHPTWAVHFYYDIIHHNRADIQRRLNLLHTKKNFIKVTETSAFASLGDQTFTEAQQREQVETIQWLGRRVRMLYWTGGEACRGCRAPAPTTSTSTAYVMPDQLTLTYTPKTSPIIWDGYPMVTSDEGKVTTYRPVLAGALLDPAKVATKGKPRVTYQAIQPKQAAHGHSLKVSLGETKQRKTPVAQTV